MYDYAIVTSFQGNECSIGVFSFVIFAGESDLELLPKWNTIFIFASVYINAYVIYGSL